MGEGWGSADQPGEDQPGRYAPDQREADEEQLSPRRPGAVDELESRGEQAAEDEAETEAEDAGASGVPLFSVPASLRSVDVAVGGRAVRGLLLVAVVLLLTLGGRWWWVNQQAAGVPVDRVTEVGGLGREDVNGGENAEGENAEGEGAAQGVEGVPTAADPLTTAPTQDPSGGGQTSLMVHVIGQVRVPGVVELPVGSRVIDAVHAAGGVTEQADPTSLNLARPVQDGEQVWVGAPGEEPPPGLQAAAPGPGPGPGGPSDGVGPGAGGHGAAPIDLNQADQAKLEELPGVGPVTAGNILAWREEHGRFTVVEELMEVSGIGEKTFEQLRARVTVSG